jgi:hypothetical protein
MIDAPVVLAAPASNPQPTFCGEESPIQEAVTPCEIQDRLTAVPGQTFCGPALTVPRTPKKRETINKSGRTKKVDFILATSVASVVK